MATMAELAKHADRLTLEHLAIVLQTLADAPPPVVVDEDFLAYGLATEVLRFFFGNTWTNENVFAQHTDVSPQHRHGRAFLKTESADLDEQFRHMQRVTTLAEIVFNLQGIEGLRERITLMQKNDLEAALGELEWAARLAAPEFNFRFMIPTGVKGQDYEAEVVTSSHRKVSCEIKTKSERTAADNDTLWYTLEEARKQLPKGKPGLILVKLPEAWIRQQNIREIVEAAIGKIFRQSHRVVSIVLAWEEWGATPEGWKTILNKFLPYRNQRSDLYSEDIDLLLSAMGRVANPHWIMFRSLAGQLCRR